MSWVHWHVVFGQAMKSNTFPFVPSILFSQMQAAITFSEKHCGQTQRSADIQLSETPTPSACFD